MHLVVPTHLSLFWVVCHPSKTFPPKEFERELQNKLSLLPTARPYPFLSLTHDPPSGARALCVLHFCVCQKLVCCLCVYHGLKACCAFCCLFLTSYGVHRFKPLFFMACFLQGLGLSWLWVFSLLAHYLLLSLACQYSCHVILLFLLRHYLIHACWASFGPTVYSSLNWLQWPNMVIGFILMLLWAFLTHYITCGLLWPISFSLGILGPFAFLGRFQSIF